MPVVAGCGITVAGTDRMTAGRIRAIGMALGAIGWGFGSPAVMVCGPLLGLLFAREHRVRTRRRADRALLDGLVAEIDRWSLSIRSGAGLVAAITGPPASDGAVGRASSALEPLLDRLRRRRPLVEAGAELLASPCPPVRLVAATVVALARSGGPVAPALMRLRHTLSAAAHDQRQRVAASAHATASAAMLGVVPVLFAVVAALLDRDLATFYLRAWGGAVCLAVAVGAGAVGWWWIGRLVAGPSPRHRRRLLRAQPDEQVRLEELASTVDLIAVVVGAGGTVGDAVDAVAGHGPPGAAAAFDRVAERRRAGLLLADALGPASDDLGPLFHPLIGALQLAAAGGAPLGVLLQRLADDADGARRRSNELQSRRLSVGLVAPLVCCHLPALVIGALAPVVIVAIERLGG